MKTQTMLLSFVLVGGPLFAGTVSFSDTTFDNLDWTVIKFIDTTPGAIGSFTVGQAGTGGNPGSYRRIEEWGVGGEVTLAHLRDGAVYNPATQGAITSLDFSFDLNAPDASLAKPPDPLDFDILLFQDGNYFTRHSLVGGLTTAWETTSRLGMADTSFEKAPGPGTPDFSSAGSPIKFGFLTNTHNIAACDAPCNVGGIDNWSVTVHFADASDAPEPGCPQLILSGLALLAVRARKRRIATR
jgi:hypothetical protein